MDKNTVKIKLPEPDVYRIFELDPDKIESVDDCKKILKFLCGQILSPLKEGLIYNGFDEVEKYFK